MSVIFNTFWFGRFVLAQHLSLFFKSVLNKWLKTIIIENYVLILELRSREALLPFVSFLKNHTWLRLKNLTDICVVDYPNKENRFEVNYYFLSFIYNMRIHVRLSTNEFVTLNSLILHYPSANWIEREVWDMFGIFFSKHNDLRRILTDYGFKGHPLRKDFPLTGYMEVFYNETKKRILYSYVSLAQEYRVFKFQNPWHQI